MILLKYSKIISSITDGLVSYISNLQDLKSEYIKQIDDFNRLNNLYENMNYDLKKFVLEYTKSSKAKKDYFKTIVNEIYDDKKLIKKLFDETRNDYLLSIYSNYNSYPMLNDFISKIKDKIDSISLMLDPNKIKEIDNKINEYLDFSDIFDKDKLISLYDTNKYIDIIDSLEIDSDIKIQAMEMGIKEFNRIYNEKLEEEYASYNELSLEYNLDLGEDYLDDFSFDEVENE